MMPKLTILATSFLVVFPQLAGASPLASYVDSVQQSAFDDLLLRHGEDVLARGLETRAALRAIQGSFPFSMNLAAVSIVLAADECRPNEWCDGASSFEPGDSAKLDFSVFSFHRSEYLTFTTGYPNLDFHRSEHFTLTTGYPNLSFHCSEHFTFTAMEFSENENVPATLTGADEVRPELTLLSGNEAAKTLRRAWKRATSQKPSLDLLVVLTAHWAHETAAGALMFNYNFGGIKGRGPEGLSCVRGAREGFGVRTRVLRDRFRAYPDAASGADDYLSLLLRKYPMAIAAAERGDVAEFVRALHDGGYFTGSQAVYVQSLRQRTLLAAEWALSALGGIRALESPSPTALAEPIAMP